MNCIYFSEEKGRLRPIKISDLESLRIWKNKHKESFFYNKEIQPNEQLNWFKGFQQRESDYMFVAEQKVKDSFVAIGCMGYRVENSEVDVYNIMRGELLEEASFSMGYAFSVMNKYISESEKYPIFCKVLKNNPALSWYLKLGFSKMEEEENYFLLKLNDFKNNITYKVMEELS